MRNPLHPDGEWSTVQSKKRSWRGALSHMGDIVDFLSFRLFIGPAVLPFCYILGAAGIPFGVWLAAKRTERFLEKQVPEAHRAGEEYASGHGYRGRIVSFFALLFVISEILWRILFEFLMAFLQMREALLFLINNQ